ncbi:MAG: agmatine deiminase family protein [Bryobacteraceae bacterium]
MKPGAGALRFGALCLIVWTSCSLSSRSGVVLLPVLAATYADAVAPGAIQRVCAEDEADLPRYLGGKGLPYAASLVRTLDGRRCHIYYEPTVSGFRASAEDAAVSELVFGIDTAAFLSRREAVVGDGLDVMKQMLRAVDRPLRVTVGLATEEDEVYRGALRHHFPESKHEFVVQRHPVEDYNPWAQDFLKAGRVGTESKMLVTRQGFEGRRSMGAEIRPLLDAYAGPRYVRSKLSWEGGDVQFAMHPKEPGKLVMFYGTSAKRYWGDGLTREEFEYVMRVEFGADAAVYMGDLAPHVDYLMTLLPEARTALVAAPVCGDQRLAKAALEVLEKRFMDGVPREVAELRGTMTLEWVEKAKQAHRGWRRRVDREKAAKVEAYWAANCPGDERRCLQNGGLRKMVTEQPEVLRMWAEVAAEAQTENVLVLRLLDIVEGQLEGCDGKYRHRLEQVIGMLGQLGFRVVRVPGIPGSTDPMSYWTGVSYVNAAVVDKKVFVPRLGLGALEDGWLEEMRREMPAGYAVVGVDARLLLLKNGGVHCVMAFGR